jgi:peptidoglycan/xylan/chitin deacetylase (PgdA/CDA1 family)
MPAVTKPNARPGLRRRRSWRRGTRVRAPERRSRQNCAFARRQNPDGYASGISRHATIASCPSPRALIEPNEGSRFHDHEIARRAISRIEARGKGILLLHDIHPATALALPDILKELKARGFKIVHVVPATADRPTTVTEPEQWVARPENLHLFDASTGRRL